MLLTALLRRIIAPRPFLGSTSLRSLAHRNCGRPLAFLVLDVLAQHVFRDDLGVARSGQHSPAQRASPGYLLTYRRPFDASVAPRVRLLRAGAPSPAWARAPTDGA